MTTGTKNTLLFIGFLLFSFNNIIGRTISSGDTIANNIIVPGFFTPDRGGAEKYYYVQSLDSLAIKTFKIQIYDRWGKKVFETNNINRGWDGKYKGKPLPDGTYPYSVDAELYNPTNYELTIEVDRTGYITLIRGRIPCR